MRRSSLSILGLCFGSVALTVFPSGCDGGQGKSTQPVAAGNPTQSPTSRPVVAAMPDNSLDTNGYVSAGAPPADRPWTAQDYDAAAKILADIAAKDASALPRFQSKRSGRYFARIISSENLAFISDPTLSLKARWTACGNLMAAMGRLMALYDNDPRFDAEMVETLDFRLRTVVLTWSLVDELPPRNADDPVSTALWAGVEEMRSNSSAMAVGLVAMLEAGSPSGKNTSRRLVSHLLESYPQLVARLSASARLEINTRLNRLAKTEQDPELTSSIQELAARTAVAPTTNGTTRPLARPSVKRV